MYKNVPETPVKIYSRSYVSYASDFRKTQPYAGSLEVVGHRWRNRLTDMLVHNFIFQQFLRNVGVNSRAGSHLNSEQPCRFCKFWAGYVWTDCRIHSQQYACKTLRMWENGPSQKFQRRSVNTWKSSPTTNTCRERNSGRNHCWEVYSCEGREKSYRPAGVEGDLLFRNLRN